MNTSNARPRRLSVLDAIFLQIETRDTPMHVASLQIFQLPETAPTDFIKSVVATLRSPGKIAHPWSLQLANVPLGSLAPAMAEATHIDMDYHVRHTCLPSPGGERELGELVSHLHSVILDRSRPLWTCHVIEGLENNRFAIYTKIHHSLTDGVRGAHMMCRCLGNEPGPDNWVAPWADAPQRRRPKTPPNGDAVADGSQELSIRGQLRSLGSAIAPLLKRKAGNEPVRIPFEAPACILNGPVTTARRVATQRLDLGRIKAVARSTNTSVNDVFLAICGTTLRRYLLEGGKLPESTLIAGVPVSLRANTLNPDSGNALGFFWSVLGTDKADPLDRLDAVHHSMAASKDHLQGIPGPARMNFTMMTMLPPMAVLLSGQGARVKPPMNVVISNVPGPDRPLYLGEARMEAMYPISIPIQGQSLNITCIGYDGQLSVGFTGSRETLPHLQRLAVYAAEALTELEDAAQLTNTTRPHDQQVQGETHG